MRRQIRLVFEREGVKMLRYIEGRVSDPAEAEDILQDVFCRALRNLNSLESVNSLVGWLYTTAKNRIIDWYRSKPEREISLQEAIDSLPEQQRFVFVQKLRTELSEYRQIISEQE